MSSLYPGAQDDGTTLPDPTSLNYTNAPSHAGLHANENAAIKAIESKLGTGASTASAGTVLAGTGAGTTSWVSASSVVTVPDATTTSKGIVQLAGDLGGTAASPTVPGLTTKQPNVTATTSQTTSFTAVANTFYPVSATGGAITATLPTTNTAGQQLEIKKTDSSTNIVTISGTINGTASSSLPLRLQDQGKVLVGDGSGNWNVYAGDISLSTLDSRYAVSAQATFTTSGVVRQTVYNVRDYGAVGDGITDDTTSVSSAVTALNTTGGGTLLFPTGYNYILSPSIQISSNTHIINQGTITLNTAYSNTTTVFKGLFRLGGTGGTDIVDNVEIEGGVVVGDCFTGGYTTNSPTFNTNNHKYVCYVHSVSTHRNVRIHDVKVTNMGSPVTFEKLGGVNGTPSRNVHVYNLSEDQVWVGVQYYCNGYLYEQCSIHDITVQFCYDDCVAVVGSPGGTGGNGQAQKIQVYNIRGDKTGQTGAFVKLDATSGWLNDINVFNLTGTTSGVGEYLIGNIGAVNAANKKLNIWGIQSAGTWNYGVYAQTIGRGVRISQFEIEALFGIHLQANNAPNTAQTIRISDGTIRSRNAALADTIEGHGIGFSSSNGTQGYQNVKIENVDTWDKGRPINEGSTSTFTDGSMSSSSTPNKLTSATANFSSKMVGYQITVVGAGASGGNLATYIASVTNSTTANLFDPALTTVSAASFTITYIPAGAGVTTILSNIMYDIDVRNSATTDSVINSGAIIRYRQNGVYLSDSQLIANALKVPTSPTSGYVLTSDTSGNATWQVIPTPTATNLTGDVTSVGAATTYNNALPVTKGGTGATANTGTGNNVLASNPALVTPTVSTSSSTDALISSSAGTGRAANLIQNGATGNALRVADAGTNAFTGTGDGALMWGFMANSTDTGTLMRLRNQGSGRTFEIINNGAGNAFIVNDGTTDNFIVAKTGALTIKASFSAAITTLSTSTTLDATHYTVLVNSASATTITLPTAVGIQGRIYNIKNINTGTVTIATTSSQTIDGITTYVLPNQYSTIEVQSDNTNWQLITPIQAEVKLSTTTGINAFTTGNTALYTVPTGKTAIITKAIVRVSAASAVTAGPTASIGGTTAGDVFASTAISALTSTTKAFSFNEVGMFTTVPAATVINFNISSAATGTSETILVDLFGYLV